jgi:hypothetical protein
MDIDSLEVVVGGVVASVAEHRFDMAQEGMDARVIDCAIAAAVHRRLAGERSGPEAVSRAFYLQQRARQRSASEGPD